MIYQGLLGGLLGLGSLAAQEADLSLPAELGGVTGAFTSTIALAVPPLAGAEPNINLVYNSNGGRGFVGIGWSLQAASTVVRRSAAGGPPTWNDAQDKYLLDGEELVADSSQGGTHQYKRGGAFARITLQDGQWTVTDLDGTKRTYAPLLKVEASTYSWGLVRVQPVRGHTVTYRWDVDKAPEGQAAYLAEINYGRVDTDGDQNGYFKVYFHRELAPRTTRQAIGGDFELIQARLRNVEVYESGTLVRAYSLVYEKSPASGYFRLTTVNRRDGALSKDGAGQISGGTESPPQRIAWEAAPAPSWQLSPAWNLSGNDNTGLVKTVPWSTTTTTSTPYVAEVPVNVTGNPSYSFGWIVGEGNVLRFAGYTVKNGGQVSKVQELNPVSVSSPMKFSGGVWGENTGWIHGLRGEGGRILIETSQGKSYQIAVENGTVSGNLRLYRGKELWMPESLKAIGNKLVIERFIRIEDGKTLYLNERDELVFTALENRVQQNVTTNPQEAGEIHGSLGEWVDLNGDGLMDRVWSFWDEPGGWYGESGWVRGAWINTGAGWRSAPEYELADGANTARSATMGASGSVVQGGNTIFIDLNGDGRVDYFTRWYNGPTGAWTSRVGLNTGAGWQMTDTFQAPNDLVATGFISETNLSWGATFRFAYLNDDRLPDILINIKDDDGGWYGNAGRFAAAYMNTGNGWVLNEVYRIGEEGAETAFCRPDAKGNQSLQGGGLVVVDLNGDRLDDALVAKHTWGAAATWTAYINTGSGWRSDPGFALPDEYMATALELPNRQVLGSNFLLRDLNGDGLQDLYLNLSNGSSALWVEFRNRIKTWLNTGRGWKETPSYAMGGWEYSTHIIGSTAETVTFSPPAVHFADLDGDGLLDALTRVYTSGVGWRASVYHNTGSGWETSPIGFPSDYIATGMVDNAADQWRHFGGFTDMLDLNGDGRADFVTAMWDDGGYWWGALGRVDQIFLGQNGMDRVTKVTSPAGASVQVTYTLQGQLPALGGTWPEGLGASPLAARPVVSTLSYHDGLATVATYDVAYGRPRYAWKEGRDLGFESISANNAFDGIVQVRYSDDPRLPLGLITRAELRSRSGELVREQVTEYEVAAGTLQPARVLQSSWRSTAAAENGGEVATRTVTYSDYVRAMPGVVRTTGSVARQGATVNDPTLLEKRSYLYNDSLHAMTLGSEESLDDTTQTRLRYSEYAYGGAGYGASTYAYPLLTAQRAWVAGGSFAETTFAYDAYGNLTGRTLPLGQTYQASYDSVVRAYALSTTSPSGLTRKSVFSLRFGKEQSSTDENDQTTERTYNDLGEEVYTILSSGPIGTSRTESAFGQPGVHTVRLTAMPGSAAEHWTEQVYDGLGRVIRERRKDGRQRTFTYVGATDKVSRESEWFTTSEGAPTYFTENSYDFAGRPLSTRLPEGTSFSLAYHGASVLFTNLQGTKTRRNFDSRGQVTSVEDTGTQGGSATVKYRYDALGRLLERITPTGTTTWSYDGQDQNTRRVDSNRGTDTYVYDLNGRVTGQTNGQGQTVTTTYDTEGRPLSDTDGSTWSYDTATLGRGRLAQTTFTGGSRVIAAYGWNGEIVNESVTSLGETRAFASKFDAYGRKIQADYPGGQSISYTYDANNGEVDSIFDGPFGSTTLWAEFIEDYSARALTVRLGNGVDQRFAFDRSTGALQRVQAALSAGKAIDFAYRYDAARRLQGADETLGTDARTLTYAYDDWNRLVRFTGDTAHGEMTWGYDNMGNVSESSVAGQPGKGFTATYAAQSDRLLRVTWKNGGGTWDVPHDQAGRITRLGPWNLTWTPHSRLKTAASTAARIDYTYDSAGNRVGAKNQNLSTGDTSYRFYYGEWSQNAVRKGGSVTTEEAVLTIRGHGRVIGEKKGAQRSFLLTDNLGSVRAVTDTGGQLKAAFDYLPYGEQLVRSGEKTDFSFSQHRTDIDTGFIYMGTRYYHPGLGRFLSPDSVDTDDQANTQTINPYAYVLNSPVNAVDPDGRFFFAFLIGALALASNIAGIVGVIATVALSFALSYVGVTTTAVGLQASFGTYPTTVNVGVYTPNGDGTTTNIATFASVTFEAPQVRANPAVAVSSLATTTATSNLAASTSGTLVAGVWGRPKGNLVYIYVRKISESQREQQMIAVFANGRGDGNSSVFRTIYPTAVYDMKGNYFYTVLPGGRLERPGDAAFNARFDAMYNAMQRGVWGGAGVGATGGALGDVGKRQELLKKAGPYPHSESAVASMQRDQSAWRAGARTVVPVAILLNATRERLNYEYALDDAIRVWNPSAPLPSRLRAKSEERHYIYNK